MEESTMKKNNRQRVALFIVIGIFLTGLSAWAQTNYYVASGGSDASTGLSWIQAMKTIQAAVNLAVDGDTVRVSNGTYNTGGSVTPGYTLTNRVCITNAITVQSVNGAEVTFISGGSGSVGTIRAVFMDNGSVLGGFTITNGYARPAAAWPVDRSGGGVWMASNCVTYNCVLSTNSADYGGGAFGGTLNNCTLSGNTAALDGGGAYESTLNNCTLSKNIAVHYGGGTYAGMLNNCIVWFNTAAYGSNIYSGTIRYTSASDGLLHGTDGNITNNPLFLNWTDGNYHLEMNSPCNNAGNNTYVSTNIPLYDLAGNPRIFDETVDMGAYEWPATTIYVDASRPDDTGAGTRWATAKKTIQAAVETANDGDRVLVTNGVYGFGGAVTPGYALTNRVCITNTISVQSVNGLTVTTIAGAPGANGSNDVDSIRGVFMTNESVLAGFTISNGYTMASGDLSLDRSGGGVWLATNCVVSNCMLTANAAADSGGGAYLNGGILNNCILTGNAATDSGGGAFSYVSGMLNNCILSENKARKGGGALLYESGAIMNNCALINNSAELNGGGVSLNYGGTLHNCTLSGNAASGNGGGVLMTQGGTMHNCIVWSNQASSSGNDIFTDGVNTEILYTCSSDGIISGTNNCITNNPQFLDSVNSNYQLRAGSPCVNTGDNIYAPTNVTPVDLAGNQRIVDRTVDMGAYERQGTYIPLDFDGDGKADIGCFYPPPGKWFVFMSGSSTLWTTNVLGGNAALPVTGNFDGDGLIDLGSYFQSDGGWFVLNSRTSSIWTNYFGFPGTYPVTGDFDEDDITDFGCYDPSDGSWFVFKSKSSSLWTTSFGFSGTLPVTGDLDGDGLEDFGCYYPPDGTWFIFKSSTKALWTTQFGFAGTTPVVGDYDGDGIDDFGCYHPPSGSWYVYKSTTGLWTTRFGYDGTIAIQ